MKAVLMFTSIAWLFLIVGGTQEYAWSILESPLDAVTVTGRVLLHGQQPTPHMIAVKVDTSTCGTSVANTRVIRNPRTAGLANAVVSLEGVRNDRGDVVSDMPHKVAISNVHCTFSPQVKAAQVGQVVEIRNEDPILHNTHITLDQRTVLNVAQLPGGRPVSKGLKKAGRHVVRCDKHKFMGASLMVFDHPYYAVTDESGSYQLPPVPPGRYTIRVWHESLGVLTQDIEVSSPQRSSVDFTYR